VISTVTPINLAREEADIALRGNKPDDSSLSIIKAFIGSKKNSCLPDTCRITPPKHLD
jgi:hypothetical protein